MENDSRGLSPLPNCLYSVQVAQASQLTGWDEQGTGPRFGYGPRIEISDTRTAIKRSWIRIRSFQTGHETLAARRVQTHVQREPLSHRLMHLSLNAPERPHPQRGTPDYTDLGRGDDCDSETRISDLGDNLLHFSAVRV